MSDIILASASPRRKEILLQAGIEFEIIVSHADEDVPESDPALLVEELARRKGRAVADMLAGKGLPGGMVQEDQEDKEGPGSPGQGLGNQEEKDHLVIGADTIVTLDGEILGKPRDEEDACAMLRDLSGRTHQVMTGVSLTRVRGNTVEDSIVFHEVTDVMMRDLSEEEIRDYVSTGDPLDKAGAYGIQGMAGMFVSGIHGDYYNVVGLPLCRLMVKLRELVKAF